MAADDGRVSTLSGWWYNQLGTRLELIASEDGSMRGSIHSEVGGVAGVRPAVGYVCPVSGRRGAIGWVVSWDGTHSIATWCGHYDLDEDVIAANWLLTAADFDENEWQSTRVGRDVFRRAEVSTQGSEAGRPQRASEPAPTR